MPTDFSTTQVTLPNTLRAILMSAADTPKGTSYSTTAAKGEPDSEITKDLAILRVAKCTELEVLVASDVEIIEGKTSLLTDLLLNTFELLVGVEATLGLTQVCLFEGTLTDEKPAKDEKVASMATKGSLSRLLNKGKASKTFCLVASTTERAPLVEILLDISEQISDAVSVDNVKHSGNEKNIFLVKSDPDSGVYSDMDSMSGDSNNEDVFLGIDNNSLFGSVANISKAKKVNIGLRIIRLMFTSEKSMIKAVLLTRKKGINMNSDIKKQEMRSDWAVVIKKIFMDTSKNMIIAAVSKFGKIKLIKIQLIEMWQKTVVKFAKLGQTEQLASRWMLLFTLLVGTTMYDLGTLLKEAGGKTCVINCSLETNNQTCYTIIDFESENELESAFCTELIFGGIRLSWTRLDLVWCEKCEKFGYSALKCDASDTLVSVLSKKNFKKNAFDFDSGSGSGFFSSSVSGFGGGSSLVLTNNSSLNAYLASLKCSLKLLSDQVSGIVCKISGIELVLLVSHLSFNHSVVPINVNLDLNLDMVLNGFVVVPTPPSVVPALGLSSLRILITKMSCLKSKLVALEALISLVLTKLDYLCANLGS
ncbi:hypothetical protein G9A89_021590 [Geosiphon pyriformis]|nr:hypothetical protein G9A89_021590 [Geosiphon pyriformis]